MSLISYN